MRRVTPLSFAVMLALACGDDTLPPPGMDASFDAARRDIGPRDAGRDAADEDAGTDSGPDSATDGGTDAPADASGDARGDTSRDASGDTGGDAGGDAGGDVGVDARFDAPDSAVSEFCTPIIARGISCEVDPCPDGSVCLDDDCGGRHCMPAGRSCVDDTDCPGGGSRCATALTGRYCVHPSGHCSDSRECPWGFACEAGACIDRRVLCGEPGDPACPPGFSCFGDALGFHPFCLKMTIPCEHDEVCPPGGRCGDVDADGRKECLPAGSCATNTDCAAGEVCGPDATGAAACGAVGPCASSDDCATGYECLDLWGDGVSECVPTGALCATSASCAPRQLCASLDGLLPPDCI